MRKIFVVVNSFFLLSQQLLGVHCDATTEKKVDKKNVIGFKKDSVYFHQDGVNESVIIKATPKVVWTSMMEQRVRDPESDYCKFVKNMDKPGQDFVEQKFKFPSTFGDAECVLHLSDTEEQRVESNYLNPKN